MQEENRLTKEWNKKSHKICNDLEKEKAKAAGVTIKAINKMVTKKSTPNKRLGRQIAKRRLKVLRQHQIMNI